MPLCSRNSSKHITVILITVHWIKYYYFLNFTVRKLKPREVKGTAIFTHVGK